MLPFAVLLPTGRAVGMTTYMNIDAATKRVEIGSTWYAPEVQRSPLNTEAKRLLLSHAFDDLECVAVEFRTHFMNHQSRRAIERKTGWCVAQPYPYGGWQPAGHGGLFDPVT